MKKLIVFIFLLTLGRISAQTAPPTLVIDFSKIEVNQDNISNYNISTIVYDDSISFGKLRSYCKEKKNAKNNTFSFRGNYIYIPFYDEDCTFIKKVNPNKVIVLSIIKQNHRMNLFIRSDRFIGIDQYLRVENLDFVPGDYFYDMCNKNIDRSMETKIDFCDIDMHIVTEKELDRLIKKDKCD